MISDFRIKGGLIDRKKPLGFSFNGAMLEGYAGDTLASALLANGIHMVGRSFNITAPAASFQLAWKNPTLLSPLARAPIRTRISAPRWLSSMTRWWHRARTMSAASALT